MKKTKQNKAANKTKNLHLDQEEKEILHAVETGNYVVADNVKEEIAKAKTAAKNSLRKDIRINIRLSSIDVEHIRQKAAYEGIPYQTLISSILHKYAAGHIECIP